jgi:fido (protein-threonine AMPylation protein)
MLEWIRKMLRLNLRRADKLEPSPDEADNSAHGLDTGDRALAQPATGGAQPHPPRPDPAKRGREHGLRGRTGGSGDAADRTRTPRDATRYVHTRLGVLSCSELAPHLARNVLALEKRIEDGEFEPDALDDALLLRFHTLICGDLVPQLAGWRRTNVTVGEHEPPDFFKVPLLAREYARDLEARLAAGAAAEDPLTETLAFAEGRLLFIHPFADFNGRVTRIWLRELLRRLDLPPVRLAPVEEPERIAYLAALRAADRNDWEPLTEVWKARLAGAGTQ